MSICKQGCGLVIRWVKADSGRKSRWRCLNPDGTDHWDLCSETRTKIVKTQGVPFTDEKGDGFIFQGKKKYFHMVAKTRKE